MTHWGSPLGYEAGDAERPINTSSRKVASACINATGERSCSVSTTVRDLRFDCYGELSDSPRLSMPDAPETGVMMSSNIPTTSDGRRIAARVPKTDSYPVIDVPQDVLNRYRAKILDPTTAVQLPGQPRPMSTVYLSDQLIVSGLATPDTHATLAEAARRFGLNVITRLRQRRRRFRGTAPSGLRTWLGLRTSRRSTCRSA